MPISITMDIKLSEIVKSPKTRWLKGLKRAASAWRSFNMDYPHQRAGSTYKRTGTLGRKSTAEVTEAPLGTTLYGVFYWKFVILGTQRGGIKIYGHRFRGQTYLPGWVGQLDKIKTGVKAAFVEGIREDDAGSGV